MLLKHTLVIPLLVCISHAVSGQKLEDALSKKDTTLAAKILIRGYNIDSLNKEGTSLLISACRYSADTLIPLFLLQHGASVDTPRSPKGRTALIVACAYYGGVPLCRLLLEAGADINAITKDGVTALMMAAANNKVDVVEYLLSRGAKPTLRDAGGKTALDYANISQLDDDVIKMMKCCKASKEETVTLLSAAGK